ncbi:ZIP family metal transporter [Oceanithermus sp.]
MESQVLAVFVYASITAIATGFGALPFAFAKSFPRNWLGLGNAAAAGLMLAASFGLIYEGVAESLARTMVGVVVGLVFILWSHRFLEKYEDLDIGDLSGLDARKALLIVGVMTLHSFAEGVGVGVSFGGGIAFGLFVTIAIAVHNIPEGLAISLVLVPRGVSWWKAALWAVFSSLPQPLMAVPAYVFVESFRQILPAGLGFAAGAMIWMAFSELIPDALEDSDAGAVATTIVLASVAMVSFQVLLGG